MTKIHLDTDLGGDIDDLCALALLLRWPGVEITGITTVCENDGKRAGYTRYALALEGRDETPVAAGAEAGGGYYRVYPGLPPEGRYWPEPVAPVQNSLQQALDLLRQSIEQGAMVIAIGALTNLALLEKQRPGILRRADLVLMGGYVYPVRPGFPQWGNAMDWNVQCDVESAKLVLESADTPLLVPLTVTVETALRRAYLPALRRAGALGELITRQAEAFAADEQNEARFGQTCAGLPEDTINFQHDPLACALALGWREGVAIQELSLKLAVEESYLVQRPDSTGKPVRLVIGIDGPRFSQFWLEQVTKNFTP
jgi:inosine-uridine nucleoside N-ribohydrolase